MKLQKLKNIKYNLLNSELIKIQFYFGVNKIFFFFFNSKYIKGFRNQYSIFEMFYIKSFLKKNLKLIYKYHVNNKKILFIGFKDLNKWTKFRMLFLKAKHYVISNIWLNGLLINSSEIQHFFLKKLKKKGIKQAFDLSYMDNSSDLIVFMTNNSFKMPLEEIDNLKVPSIFFLTNFSKKNCLAYYTMFGNFTSQKSKIFIYLLLKSVLTFSKIVIKKNVKKYSTI
jgi:ribosomal protein S2